MTHRFIHIGDLHLGPNTRNEDRMRAFDQILSEQIGTGVSAYLFPGDINHGRMSIPDKNFLVSRARRLADDAPLVVAVGNHDLPGDLDFLSELKGRWPIYVVTRPQTIRIPLATGGCAAIFCLPYPQRAGLVSVGVQSDHLVDAARQALDVIFMVAADELARAIADGCVPLMIGHVNVGGAIVSSGQPNIGAEIELDRALLDRLGPVYKGLSHIHCAQEIGGAHYAGSCCRLDWSEVDPKSYNVVTYDIEPGGIGHSDVWIYDVERKPLNVAPMYQVEGNLTREGFEWWIQRSSHPDDIEKPGEAPPGGWAGCEVRVRYRFNANEKTALDEALVRAPFEGAKRLELDPIGVRERASRAPEVAAALTFDAKVEAFVRRSGVPWTPELTEKLSRLLQTDGAAFLTDVQNSLSGPQTTGSLLSPPAAPDSPVGPDTLMQEVGAL